MNKNRFVRSVLPSSSPVSYPSAMFSDKKELEKKLNDSGLKITIVEPLKGGTVSQVYGAKLEGKNVVVKHVDNLIPFDPTEFFIGKEGLEIDVEVLNKLKDSKIRAPKIIKYFPDINTVVMEDLREEGFVLLSDQIIAGKLPIESAKAIGQSLSDLANHSKTWDEIETYESAEQSVYERGLELRLAYPNSQDDYLYLEKEFVSNNKFFCWPDGHPKNILINGKGDCAFIDFGRSVWADQRYMLPNFLAHIVLYSIAGYVEKPLAKEYLKMCIGVYKENSDFNEEIFCKYLAMEVFHRANGKWISGIDKKDQKLALLKFAYTIFDDKTATLSSLLELI